MRDQSRSAGVIASADLREYFHESIGDALNRQGVDATVETVYYIVNLLTVFQRSDRLFDFNGDRLGIRPLAMLYADALEGRRLEERNRILQRMGDVALFISGVFSESFSHKLIDVDYYIGMGSNAYGHLSDSMRGTTRGDTFCAIFEELSTNFTCFADALSELNESVALGSDADILRQYELWLRTGSRRARERLRKSGIEPGAAGSAPLVRTDH
jgi:hypothetical protein